MVTGSVNAALEANVRFSIQDRGGHFQEVEATVDTGYTRFLTLPIARITALGLRYLFDDLAVTGDGRVIQLAVYAATVVWDGQSRTIEVQGSDIFPLVGMSMMLGYH